MHDWKGTAIHLDRLYQKLGRQYGPLSRPQKRFLHVIFEANGIGVTTLSELLEMTVAGATRMLDTLESDGYIERKRQVEDARQVKVYLTEKGNQTLSEADSVYLSRLKELLSTLSSDELETLNQLLSKVKG